MSLPAPRLGSAGNRAGAGWVLYGFAYVVLATNLLSVYFPIWIVDDAGGRDSDYGLVNGASMALVFVISPVLGVLLDRIPRRMPLLVTATVVTCLCVSLIGMGGLGLALTLFFVANVVFQTGVLVYDSLLPTVSTEDRSGRLSGAGVAAGFGGAVIGILIGMVVLAVDEHAEPTLFKITALVFLLSALPCFFWVRESPRTGASRVDRATLQHALSQVRATRAFLRAHPRLRRFLIGRLFYSDAANTLLAFLGIYATKELGFSDFATQILLLTGILVGPFGALTAGLWADTIGPLVTLRRSLLVWLAVLVLAAGVPLFVLPIALFWLIAPLAGIAIGATPSCDRPALVSLAPPGEVGRAMGLYAMVGRFSSVSGPLIWAAIVGGLGLGRPVAVVSLTGMVLIALWVLNPLRDA
jgi:UMF1 family MFS transporter